MSRARRSLAVVRANGRQKNLCAQDMYQDAKRYLRRGKKEKNWRLIRIGMICAKLGETLEKGKPSRGRRELNNYSQGMYQEAGREMCQDAKRYLRRGKIEKDWRMIGSKKSLSEIRNLNKSAGFAHI